MITNYCKDNLTIPIELTDPEGTGINLTSATIQFTLATPTIITESTVGVTVTKGTYGNILIKIIPSVMRLIPAAIYKFEVRVIYTEDIEDTLFIDKLQLLGGVPRV